MLKSLLPFRARASQSTSEGNWMALMRAMSGPEVTNERLTWSLLMRK